MVYASEQIGFDGGKQGDSNSRRLAKDFEIKTATQEVIIKNSKTSSKT